MLVRKWTLLVGVAFNATSIRTGGQPRLLKFEAAVRVMAIGTLHRSLEHFMMEGRGELWFDFAMAAQTKLRLTDFQHLDG